MSSEIPQIFVLSLAAMANPTLLTAVTVMLLLPEPKRLLAGYLFGAYVTAIGTGLIIVFALPNANNTNTSQRTINPIEDFVIGSLLLLIAWVLKTDRDRPFEDRRRIKKEEKLEARRAKGKPTESLPLRLLGKGDPRITFVVGMVLSFPGVAYLVALGKMNSLNAGTAPTVLLIIGFVLIEMTLLELPLLGYIIAPEGTADRVNRFKNWMGRRGRTAAITGLTVMGLLLVVRAVLTMVS